MKKTHSKILASVLGITLLAGCGGGTSNNESSSWVEEKTSGEILLDDVKFLHTYGRVYNNEDTGVLEFSNTASGFGVRFQGTQLYAGLKGTESELGVTYLSVFVDGAFYKTLSVNNTQSEYLLYEGTDESIHEIKVLKRTESQYTQASVSYVEGEGDFYSIKPESKTKIAFYGDSITCGYGNLGNKESVGYKTAEQDGLQTYATMVAEKLNADIDIMAASGWGIDKTYPDCGLIPTVFDKYSIVSNEIYLDVDTETDYVVINLGTNDGNVYYGTHQSEIENYKDAYYTFYEDIRATYPNAHIVLTIGLLGVSANMFTSMYDVANMANENGDENISAVALTTASGNEIAAGHPIVSAHEKAAEELYAHILEITNE